MDLVNSCPELAIKFPTKEEHIKIAQAFKQKLKVNFEICAGCIDGVLVWLNKFSDKDLEGTNIGPGKFYNGRKHKFGMNMLAVCDHLCRFLDVDTCHPGATSDYLAFCTSNLLKRIEEGDLLAAGSIRRRHIVVI